jgi:uncharacterized protein YeaO (DUF488 family)
MLRTKSVYEPIDKRADGLRILVTRFRGRYMPTSRYDVWMPSLGPSERLLRSVTKGKLPWSSFVREYRAELFLAGGVDSRNRTIKNHGQLFALRLIKTLARKGPVTLMCHCSADELECHRHVLRRLILSSRV